MKICFCNFLQFNFILCLYKNVHTVHSVFVEAKFVSNKSLKQVLN